MRRNSAGVGVAGTGASVTDASVADAPGVDAPGIGGVSDFTDCGGIVPRRAPDERRERRPPPRYRFSPVPPLPPLSFLTPLMIGPLGMQEMLIIMGVALIVFGPRKLPQIGKTLGRSLAEFRRTSSELRSTLEREVEMEEFRSAREEVRGAGDNLRAGLDPDAGAPRRTRPPAPGRAPGPGRSPDPAEPAPAEAAAAPTDGTGAGPEAPGPREAPRDPADADGESRQEEEEVPEAGDPGAPEGADGGAPVEESTPSR